tara:strand:- start:1092 stop:1370 length:279 start_codon:yes stop_codon:yes gene_type:complete
MKKINRLRRVIKEIISEEMPLSSHLTFSDGVYPREDVSETDKLKTLEIIESKNILRFEYSYSAKYADGVIVTFPDGKKYLVTHTEDVIPYIK